MKLKKRMFSILLVLAVMVTFMPAATLSADAASKKTSNKVYTVSSEKNEIGDNTKYTYNKKGFVTKAVSKYTSKDSDSDTVETVTTTYKYNKKNRITKKTTTDVEKVTTYKTNKTTGKSTGQSLGTVTTTTKDVTAYTYKNGRATKAVTTSTTVKSGSLKEENVSLRLDEFTELSNGNFIAGFNYRNADGSYNDEDTSANAYYYTGNIKAAESKGTTTTTYKDNGDGTYTRTNNYASSSSNYKTTPKKTYYKMDENGKYVVCTDKDDYDFSRTESVEVAVDASGTGDSYNRTTTDVITDQTVTTTVFKYDKKKRVKQANITTVYNDASETAETDSSTSTYNDSTEDYDADTDDYKTVEYTATSKESSSSKSSWSTTETTSQVEKYTYDKKNRKTKKVVTDNGVMNRVDTNVDGRRDSTEETQRVYKDGTKSSYKETSTYSGEADTTTTVYANGTRTTTTTNNPYTRTRVSSDTYRSGGTEDSETKTDFTFFKNGGSKTDTVEKETSKDNDGTTVRNTTSTRYEYDNTGKKYSYTSTYSRTSTPADGTAPSSYQNTYSYYNDGTGEKTYYDAYKYDNEPEEVDTNDAALKKTAEDANAALIAYGTPYTETKSKAVKAKPSKATTNYKYDKQGNLKSAKTSGSWSEVETLRNETYGNDIYQFDSNSKLEEVETVVSHTYKTNRTKENTVKDGSNRVKSAMSVGTRSEDRATPSYYSVDGRVTYTLKSKTIAKKSVRNDVELQQWIIQNPGCGSVAGLF